MTRTGHGKRGVREIGDFLHIESLACYTKVNPDGSFTRLDEGLDSVHKLFESQWKKQKRDFSGQCNMADV
jgi:hypothetical protein